MARRVRARVVEKPVGHGAAAEGPSAEAAMTTVLDPRKFGTPVTHAVYVLVEDPLETKWGAYRSVHTSSYRTWLSFAQALGIPEERRKLFVWPSWYGRGWSSQRTILDEVERSFRDARERGGTILLCIAGTLDEDGALRLPPRRGVARQAGAASSTTEPTMGPPDKRDAQPGSPNQEEGSKEGVEGSGRLAEVEVPESLHPDEITTRLSKVSQKTGVLAIANLVRSHSSVRLRLRRADTVWSYGGKGWQTRPGRFRINVMSAAAVRAVSQFSALGLPQVGSDHFLKASTNPDQPEVAAERILGLLVVTAQHASTGEDEVIGYVLHSRDVGYGIDETWAISPEDFARELRLWPVDAPSPSGNAGGTPQLYDNTAFRLVTSRQALVTANAGLVVDLSKLRKSPPPPAYRWIGFGATPSATPPGEAWYELFEEEQPPEIFLQAGTDGFPMFRPTAWFGTGQRDVLNPDRDAHLVFRKRQHPVPPLTVRGLVP